MRCFGLAVLLVFVVGVAACAGHAPTGNDVRSPVLDASQTINAGSDFPNRSIALADALSELEELEAPVEVDPDLFQQLKDELAKVLREQFDENGNPTGKHTLAIGAGEANRAWGMNGSTTLSGTVKLNWWGRHVGDYDLNSEVNVSDITPLGLFFKGIPEFDDEGLPVVSGTNEHQVQVDGDFNLEINIADITPVGVNFKSKLLGYRVYLGRSTDGTNITWDTAFVENPDNPGDPYTVPFQTSRKQGEVQRYEVSFARPAVAPGEVLYAKAVPWDGEAEGVETVMPVPEGPHQAFECSVCHKLLDYEVRAKETSCHMCHANPPGSPAEAWTSAPLLHQECMNCHNAHLFAISPPESACGTCHSTIAGQLVESTMTACMDCHDTAHIPNAQPVAADCAECHSGPAATLADELMQDCNSCHNEHAFVQTYTADFCKGCHDTPPNQPAELWANAPGMHGDCAQCHDLHDFKVADANGVCATCHQAKIDEGHAGGSLDCLGCHNYPHVPEIAITGECVDCHTNPPENPLASWDDAPGQHDQCLLCHPGDHPDVPDPPHSVCGTCHADQTGPGHGDGTGVCLNCHTYPHLPEVPVMADLHDVHIGEGLNCSDCHSGMHGGLYPDRDTCLACHPEQENHNPGQLCQDCHN